MDSELNGLSHSPHSHSNLEDGPIKDDLPLLKNSSKPTTSDDDTSTPHPDIQELEKKYAAYVRHDVYGTMGRGNLPWTQKLLLGIALITLFPLRIVLATLVVVLYYLICRACTLCLVPNREDEQEDYAHMGGWRRTIIYWVGRLLSRALLFVIGFYWIKETYRNPDLDNKFNHQLDENGELEECERPGAIISNHVSHLDILYHMSSSFPSFVAKRSVSKLPLIGLISKCLGCVYVERESKSSEFKGVSGLVSDRIQESLQDKSAPMMMLFPESGDEKIQTLKKGNLISHILQFMLGPEGTTTNGDYILPFKTGAFLSKAPVLPVILRYPYQRFSPAWDTISGIHGILSEICILHVCHSSIGSSKSSPLEQICSILVLRLPLYFPSQEEKDDPKLYAENVRRLMAREGNLIMSDIGLAEKRVYHAAVHGLFS